MELNSSPVLTSRNYGINFAKVDDSVFCDKISSDFYYKIENGVPFLRKNIENCNFFNKIGEKFDEQLQNNSNCDLNFIVDKNCEKTIFLDFQFDKINRTLVDKITFVIEKNINVKIVINYRGDSPSYHNGLLKFVCKDSSKIDIVVISDLSYESTNVLRMNNLLEENSELNYYLIDFGAKTSVQNFYSKLEKNNAISNLHCLYIADEDEFLDLNFVQDIFGQRGKANIQVVGALMKEARKNFKGTINFEKGCKKSVGTEDELCLLLSNKAKSKALPMLLCTEEDVDGKHSTSVGKVGEKELFYIMSRGFSYQDALKLVVNAKFNGILDKISDENVKQSLVEIIDRKIRL